jgi:hypothetical protein
VPGKKRQAGHACYECLKLVVCRQGTGQYETERDKCIQAGTNFEIRQTLMPVNKIKHLRMQIAAKQGKIYAIPQPDATKVLVKDKRSNRRLAPPSL